MLFQKSIEVVTPGRGTTEITAEVQRVVGDASIDAGLCHLFVHHTSASLMLCENADPDVRTDLETFMLRLVPDGSHEFVHTAEGPDDMPAHVRTVLTHSDLLLPVARGRCDLGTWQGIYLWEHRTAGHRRRITLSLTAGD